MSPVLPREIVDRIKEETDIVTVVRQYVSLRPAGTAFKGLCPFHQEKTPSFHVNPQRQIFKCFGCGEGGDVITFLMKLQGLSFPEALEVLARPLNLDLARYLQEEEAGEGEGERQAYFRALAVAAQAWQDALWGERGKTALAYLRERGFGEEILRRYDVGFAPPGTAWLTGRLERDGVSAALAQRAGLLRVREGGEPFAYFRNRIIFPVRNIAQRITGFGGRILGEGEPKYLNSAESPWFNKRKLLYGFARSRIPIARRKAAILVEGYLDLLAMVQAGFAHCVATCGTSFTVEQARAMRHGCRTLFILYDGDRAGVKAAVRAAGTALAAGLEPRIVLLPEQEDPASFLQGHAPEALAELLQEAPGYIPLLRRLAEDSGTGRVGVERAVRRALADIAALDDPLRRALLLDELAGTFGLEREVLREELARLREGAPRHVRQPAEPSTADAASPPRMRPSPIELQLLAHALADDTGAAAATAVSLWDGRPLSSPLATSLLEDLRRWHAEAAARRPGDWIQSLWHERDDDYRRLVAELLDHPEAGSGSHAQIVGDCWDRLMEKRTLAARSERLRRLSTGKGAREIHGEDES